MLEASDPLSVKSEIYMSNLYENKIFTCQNDIKVTFMQRIYDNLHDSCKNVTIMSYETSDNDQASDPIPEVLIVEQHTDDDEQDEEEEHNSSEIPNSSVLINNVYPEEKYQLSMNSNYSQKSGSDKKSSETSIKNASSCCLII